MDPREQLDDIFMVDVIRAQLGKRRKRIKAIVLTLAAVGFVVGCVIGWKL